MVQTTQGTQDTAEERALYVALELSKSSWKLAFSDGRTRQPRVVSMPARDWPRFAAAVTTAQQRFDLRADGPVRSCYEAGRDGFWIHRVLLARGITNIMPRPCTAVPNRMQVRHGSGRVVPDDRCAHRKPRPLAHPAGPDGGLNLIRPEASAGLEGHRAKR